MQSKYLSKVFDTDNRWTTLIKLNVMVNRKKNLLMFIAISTVRYIYIYIYCLLNDKTDAQNVWS